MKLSQSAAVAILSSLAAVEALVIPLFDDLPAEFALVPMDAKAEVISDVPVDSAISDAPIAALNDAPSPLVTSLIASQNLIPNSYIVVFKNGLASGAVDFHMEWLKETHSQTLAALSKDMPAEELAAEGFVSESIDLTEVFSISDLFSGYTGYFPEKVVDLIRRHPDVAFVEQDSRVFADKSSTQNGAPWGLSRISHREPLSLGNFNEYVYDDLAGDGVTAYVIDTGINVKHEQFGGRAEWGKTIPTGDDDIDGNGHGTHCAGTIGSEDYGVSKNSKIVAVKVLRSNGSGSMSDVIKGVEFAANDHVAKSKAKKDGFKGSTANMSLGGGKSPALDLAVNAAVKAGLHFAVAAGNDNADACNYSPAAAENAVTVGASTLSDSRAYFSNYGKCVDIFAPGLNILSTYIGSDTATATLSGTSMASPHVCGLLTYFLSLQPESSSLFSSAAISPAQLKKNLIKFGTKNVLSEIPSDGTPNILIYNGAGKNISDFWAFEDEASAKSDLKKAVDIATSVDLDLQDIKEKFNHILEEVAEEVADLFD
uniref:Proteinase B n=1 Tax=Ogataea minuta TaxID=36026 RepID=Q25C40_9ASCO|nr:Proteinase B [Ogataea minuta]